MSTKLVSALSVFAAVAVLSSGPAMAGVCGVERVDRAGPTSIRLYLIATPARRVEFIHAGKKQWFDVAPPSPGIGFAAQLGDQVVSHNPRCLMTVTKENGRLGVDVRGRVGPTIGWVQPPNTGFIPAQ